MLLIGPESSDDESAESSSDDESVTADEPMHLSDDEDTVLGLDEERHIDEVNVEVAAAMDHAEVELKDTIAVKEKNLSLQVQALQWSPLH